MLGGLLVFNYIFSFSRIIPAPLASGAILLFLLVPCRVEFLR